MPSGVRVKTNQRGFREVMRSAGVARAVESEAFRAKYRAEQLSGLRFGAGVDMGPVSAHGWVGTSFKNVSPKAIARLLGKAADALAQSLHGI